jgi:hypothetical protein
MRVAIAVLLFTVDAAALPAPMNDDELAKRAELVVEAEVSDVKCAASAVDKGDFVVTEYRSELAVRKTIYGKATPSIALRGYRLEWKKDRPTSAPPPAPPLPKGWRGTLYLDALPDGEWMPVWHNALQEDLSSSHPGPLPACGGGGCSGCTVGIARGPAPKNDAMWPYFGLLLVAVSRWSGAGFLLESWSLRAAGRLPRRPAR